MGTRAVTNVVDEKGEVYVSLYRQFDGYPNGGHGEELANWLDGAVIGNGIRGGESRPKFFNGIGDLALRLVTYFREDHTRIGSFYLIPPGTEWSPDFTYTITAPDIIRSADNFFDNAETSVRVSVNNYGTDVFEGTVEDFKNWVLTPEDEEE